MAENQRKETGLRAIMPQTYTHRQTDKNRRQTYNTPSLFASEVINNNLNSLDYFFSKTRLVILNQTSSWADFKVKNSKIRQ